MASPLMTTVGVDEVFAVLLADGWHDVRGNSFMVGEYGFVQDQLGTVYNPKGAGKWAVGFAFEEEEPGSWIAGPIAAIQALRYVVAR